LVGIGTELSLFTAAHKTSEFLNFNPTVLHEKSKNKTFAMGIYTVDIC